MFCNTLQNYLPRNKIFARLAAAPNAWVNRARARSAHLQRQTVTGQKILLI
jgi:hypothetical protein